MVVMITLLPCEGTAGGCLLFFGAGGGGRLVLILPTAPSDKAGDRGGSGSNGDCGYADNW
jgi:hypothetical protein